MAKAAEEALSVPFCIGFESANNGLQTALFYIEKRVSTKRAQNCTLEEVFNRTVEHWTQ